MATYQNIFTQVQVKAEPELGVPHLDGSEPRINATGYSYWMGKFGQAQLASLRAADDSRQGAGFVVFQCLVDSFVLLQ